MTFDLCAFWNWKYFGHSTHRCGSNPLVSLFPFPSLPVGRWASFRGAAGSVRLHGVRSREGGLSHGCQPAEHDAGQGWIWWPKNKEMYSFMKSFSIILCLFLQAQISDALLPGEEEGESSADDLTPSVTSNTSDLLPRPQGITCKDSHLHMHTLHLK